MSAGSKFKNLIAAGCLLCPSLGRSAAVSISARYSEAADIFIFMDCVSRWWNGTFCNDDGEYQKEWDKRFDLSSEDKQLFAQYDKLRRKYYRGLGSPKEDIGPYSDGLFAKRASITEDLVAPAFYASTALNEAFDKLKTVLTSEDLRFLKSFYEKFSSKYQQVLSESLPFKAKAAALNQKLSDKKFADFFEKISKYYSVTELLNYEVLYTWYPPVKRDVASPVNRFLVLQKNPIKHLEKNDEDVVFHEIVHTLSVRQPQQQKEEISKAFLESCPITDKFSTDQKMKILEEPMAVAVGQILFLKTFFPERVKWEAKFYNNPWISSFAKTIYPAIESEFAHGEAFSVNTGKKLGVLCGEFLQAADLVGKVRK